MPDGASASLVGVLVRDVNSDGSFTVREGWSDAFTLSITPAEPVEISPLQTVDVSGTILIVNGKRQLNASSVRVYTDSAGSIISTPLPVRTEDGAILPWQWKDDAQPAATIAPSGMMSSMNAPPPYSINSSSEPEYCDTIAAALAKDEGTFVELHSRPVTSGGAGLFEIGEDASIDTMSVYYTGSTAATDRILVLQGAIDIDGSQKVLAVDSGPNFDPQTNNIGIASSATAGTVAWVKSYSDGRVFSAGEITGKVVTQVWPDSLYIEDDSRASGIRVEKASHNIARGARVSVTGTLFTNANAERYIAATAISQTGSGVINPLVIRNSSLGGSDFAYNAGPPQSGQRGVYSGHGLNNIGLLVKTTGKVTAIDTASQWYKLDDGSKGVVKVAYPANGYQLNEHVAVTGISSLEVDIYGNRVRVLRPQPLTCTITQAQSQVDPTSAAPIYFTATFSEPVTDFDDSSDVSISGTAGGARTVTITQTDTDGRVYAIAISNLTNGTVIANIPAGKAQSLAGVWNYPATTGDNTVSIRGDTVFVQTPANGGNDNNSGWRWDNAKATVGAALASASQNSQQQVWVAKGTYYERITLPAGIALYGGFAGSENVLNDRASFPRPMPDANETILDGQSFGSVITGASTTVQNTVNGFTIRNGSPWGITSTTVLSILNCRVTANANGIKTTANTLITGNELFNNSGDGIWLESGPGGGGTVSNNRIYNNSRRGIYCKGGGSSGYLIDRNRLEYNNTSSPVYSGGGVSLDACTGIPKVVNNFIRGNGGVNAGGIYCYQSTANIYNNTMVDNFCTTSGRGAGIYVRNSSGQNMQICNNILLSNDNGYGVYRMDSGYTITLTHNCTYANNYGNYGSNPVGLLNPIVDFPYDPYLYADMLHLTSFSVYCIDKANVSYVYGQYSIDGTQRMIDGDSNGTALADIGCDEYVP